MVPLALCGSVEVKCASISDGPMIELSRLIVDNIAESINRLLNLIID